MITRDVAPPERTERGPVNLVKSDFASFTASEKLHHLEVEGFVVFPRLLDSETIQNVRSELADLPMYSAPYSDAQTAAKRPPHWHSRTFAELIGHPELIRLLELALGSDFAFTLGHFVRTGPGVPGLSLHSDYQPYGSKEKGWEESSPATVRVLTYLDDLTVERGAFTFLPRSHLSLHQASNPYVRFDDHPEMVTVEVPAGSAIAFNVRGFHGTHPNASEITREMMEFAYRPSWARPAGEVEEWPPEEVQKLPAAVRSFFKPRNEGVEGRGPIRLTNAERKPGVGLSPSRWD